MDGEPIELWRPPLLFASGVLGTVPGMVIGGAAFSGVEVGRCSGDCADAGTSGGTLLGVAIGGPIAGVATVCGVAQAGPRHSPILPVVLASLAPLALIPVALEIDPNGGLWGGVTVLGPPIAAAIAATVTSRPDAPGDGELALACGAMRPGAWCAMSGRW